MGCILSSRKFPRGQHSDLNYLFPVFQILAGRAMMCYDDFFFLISVIKYEQFILLMELIFLKHFQQK